MIGVIGMILSLALLIYIAYRGVSIIILSPIMAIFAILFTWGTPILATYTQVFMPAIGKFIVLYFPLFLLGSLFGKLMDDSGSAKAIAYGIIRIIGSKHAALAVIIACAVLTYGGVSLFVVAFAIYPIAAILFRESDIPKRLIPASIGLGAFTFTMTALPGTPSIQNAIPMPYFGTDTFAAPGLSIVAAIIMFSLGHLWISFQIKSAILKGEGYENQTHIILGKDINKNKLQYIENETNDLPDFTSAIVPIILVISLNYILSTYFFPSIDTSYLATSLYGNTDLNKVVGIWSIICSLTMACVTLIMFNRKKIKNLVSSLDKGANNSLLPIFNTASLVGFGAVIASLPAFSLIKDNLENIGGNPLLSLAASVSILAGITGSASGGMSIALQTLGESYMIIAQNLNIDPALFHRITVIATGSLDSLPHNGAVVTLLGICNLKHKDAYKDIFIVTLICPSISLICVLILGTLFGSF